MNAIVQRPIPVIAPENVRESHHSRAVINIEVPLGSLHAQRIMNKSFERLKWSLFSISVILPIVCKDDDEIEQIEDFVTKEFKKLDEHLSAEEGRMLKIIEDNGINARAVYSKPSIFLVSIDNPRAKIFLNIISRFDNVMLLLETCWLAGELDDRQRKRACYDLQHMIMRSAARIVVLSERAYKAAVRIGKKDEADRLAPRQQDNGSPEMDDAVTAVASEDTSVPMI